MASVVKSARVERHAAGQVQGKGVDNVGGQKKPAGQDGGWPLINVSVMMKKSRRSIVEVCL